MSSDIDISVAALAIALVAVLAALGQVFQQYYSTAEGTRRCQSSVIGPWQKETKWRFRWTELRFEILFKSPHIVIDGGTSSLNFMSGLKLPSQKPSTHYFDYLASESSKDHKNEEDSNDQMENEEIDQLVCWVPLLEELWRLERGYVDYLRNINPAFVPPLHRTDTFEVYNRRSFLQTIWRPRSKTTKYRDFSLDRQKPRQGKHQPVYPALRIVTRTWDLLP